MTAPWITLRPTPPQPMTATVSPGLMFAVFVAAPTPVSTPQPMRAAMSRGMSSGIFTAPMAGMTAASENVPEHAICRSGSPSFENRVVPSSRPPVAIAAGAGLAQEALALLAEEALRRTAAPRR